jgi:hypothetical protein
MTPFACSACHHVDMDRVECSKCGYRVGLGTASEPGVCPRCKEPLMLTSELRSLSAEEVRLAKQAARKHHEDRQQHSDV